MKSRIVSKRYYKQAVKVIPGGVNSPVRAFGAVGGSPVFIEKGKGSRVYDVDGNAYIDYVLSWGPLILGHAHQDVVKAVRQAAAKGMSFGAPTKAETQLAEMITGAFPGMQKVRLVNSGTEAVMSAIRLARGFTKRNKIIKFEGSYHGHSASVLVKAGSGAATFGAPTSAGVPRGFTKNTIVLPYNDIKRVRSVIAAEHSRIAAVIVEPVCGNMGVVLPKRHFLSELRALTERYRIVLIFDEVMTCFRFCFGGVQNIFHIKPDITCLGKIIGGGLPIGAYGGRKEIMNCVAPLGPVYQAGTLSGNPIAVACGLKTLRILKKMDYNTINDLCTGLCSEIAGLGRKKKTRFCINRMGSMFTFFFTKGPVTDYRGVSSADTRKYALFFRCMLDAGVYMAPSQFEANFMSFAHTEKDITHTIRACQKALTVVE